MVSLLSAVFPLEQYVSILFQILQGFRFKDVGKCRQIGEGSRLCETVLLIVFRLLKVKKSQRVPLSFVLSLYIYIYLYLNFISPVHPLM